MMGNHFPGRQCLRQVIFRGRSCRNVTVLARRSKEDRGIWTIGGSWEGRHRRAHDDVSPDWTLMPTLSTLSETIPSL